MRENKHNIFLFNKKGLIITSILLTQTLVGVGVIKNNFDKNSKTGSSVLKVQAMMRRQNYQQTEVAPNRIYDPDGTKNNILKGAPFFQVAGDRKHQGGANPEPSQTGTLLGFNDDNTLIVNPQKGGDSNSRFVSKLDGRVLQFGTIRILAKDDKQIDNTVGSLKNTSVKQMLNIFGNLYGVVTNDGKKQVIKLTSKSEHKNANGFKYGQGLFASQMDVPENGYQTKASKVGVFDCRGKMMMVDKYVSYVDDFGDDFFKNSAERQRAKLAVMYNALVTYIRSVDPDLTEFNPYARYADYRENGLKGQRSSDSGLSIKDLNKRNEQEDSGLFVKLLSERIVDFIYDNEELKSYLDLENKNKDEVSLYVAKTVYALNEQKDNDNDSNEKVENLVRKMKLGISTGAYFNVDKNEVKFILKGSKDGYDGYGASSNKQFSGTMRRFSTEIEKTWKKIWKEMSDKFSKEHVTASQYFAHGDLAIDTLYFRATKVNDRAVCGVDFEVMPKNILKQWYFRGNIVNAERKQTGGEGEDIVLTVNPGNIYEDYNNQNSIYALSEDLRKNVAYNLLADMDESKIKKGSWNNDTLHRVASDSDLFRREGKAFLKAMAETQDKALVYFRSVWDKLVAKDRNLRNRLGDAMNNMYDSDEKSGLQEFGSEDEFLSYVKNLAEKYKALAAGLKRNYRNSYEYNRDAEQQGPNSVYMDTLQQLFEQAHKELKKLFKLMEDKNKKGVSNYFTLNSVIREFEGLCQFIGNRILNFHSSILVRDFQANSLYMQKLKTVKNKEAVEKLNENLKEFLIEMSKSVNIKDVKQMNMVANLIGGAINSYGQANFTTKLRARAQNINQILLTMKNNKLVDDITPLVMLIRQIVHNESLELYLNKNIFREMYNIMNFDFELGKTGKDIKFSDFKLDVDTALTPGENYKNLLEAFIEFAVKDRNTSIAKFICFSREELKLQFTRLKDMVEKVAKTKEDMFDADKTVVDAAGQKKEKPKVKVEEEPETQTDAEKIVEDVVSSGRMFTMPLFSNKENSVLAQGTVSYRIKDKTVEVELNGIKDSTPTGLDVYCVPVLEDQAQPRIDLQKFGNTFRGTTTLPSVEGRMSLHFYFVDPAARQNGPNPQFYIGAADICNVQNIAPELLKKQNSKLINAFFSKKDTPMTNPPEAEVYDLDDYVFVYIKDPKGIDFSRMMAVACGDKPLPSGGSNDMTVSTMPQGGYGILIYKNIKKLLTDKITVHFYKDVLLDSNMFGFIEFDVTKPVTSGGKATTKTKEADKNKAKEVSKNDLKKGKTKKVAVEEEDEDETESEADDDEEDEEEGKNNNNKKNKNKTDEDEDEDEDEEKGKGKKDKKTGMFANLIDVDNMYSQRNYGTDNESYFDKTWLY